MGNTTQTFRPKAQIEASTASVITNQATLANTETSHAFAASTKQFMIKARGASVLKYAFIATQSGTNYITLPKSVAYVEDNVNLPSNTIYFQTSLADTVEIQEWA